MGQFLIILLMVAVAFAMGIVIFGLFAWIGGPIAGAIALALWIFRGQKKER